MTVPLLEFGIERLREEELEEARAIQSVMLPGQALQAGGVRISHEFQPIAAVGGDAGGLAGGNLWGSGDLHKKPRTARRYDRGGDSLRGSGRLLESTQSCANV
jgi:hypothetical protein